MSEPNRKQATEDLRIRLSKGCGIVEEYTGDRPHVATMHRWATNGLKGVKLRTQYTGGHRRTTRRWIKEFFENVTAVAEGREPSKRPDCNRESQIDSAAKELEAAGI